MAHHAIGDVQGCLEPLQALLHKLDFSADRDQLTFVGDLVNRGPDSLGVLRFVHSLGQGARVVLGNHDLHLLALHHDPQRRPRAGDTLDDVLAAPDREALLSWLIQQPLLIDDAAAGDLIVHAGIVPDWNLATAIACARAASLALRADPKHFLQHMYGNKPERWRDATTVNEKHRFTVNVLTRMRYCRADGTIDLKMKGSPGENQGAWKPWFGHAGRQLQERRIVFGHWSTLGLLHGRDIVALDTGCVWGGALSAIRLDVPDATPVQVPCRACQLPGGD